MLFIYKEMDKSHVKNVAQIEKDCFSHPWSKNAFYEELENPLSLTVVAVDEASDVKNTAGFINVRIIDDEVYINNIAVKKEYRGKGIGKGLLSALEKRAQNMNVSFITLEVRESNFPAISLYSKLGYKSVGKRKRFYRSPTENAVIMTKTLL